MEYIGIPGLKRNVSRLILGTDYYSPSIMDRIAPIMDEFVALGGNTFDTAHIYAGGASERAIGQWVRERNLRHEINLWTKGAHPHRDSGPRVHPEAIELDLMQSLDRLQTDFVDMYALHRDDPNVPVGSIMEALNKHLEAGRILAVGASNWTHERLQEANDYAEAHGLIGFSFSSPNLSLARANEPFWPGCVSADDRTTAWHTRLQLPLLSWSAQARGFFSGRFTPDDASNADIVRVFYHEDNWERLRRAETLAARKGCTTIQIALAYVLHQPFPTCALIGPANTAELRSCNEAAGLRLAPEDVQWLERG